MKRVGLLIGCVLMLLFTVTSGVMADEMKQSTLDKIIKRGELRVGMSTFVPWAMKDKTGKLIGFEIDVATRLAEDMGVKVKFIPTKWSGIIPALLTGKYDVIIGGMGILPKRNLKVNFTMPYDFTGMSMVASKKKAAGFNKLDDFNKEGIVVTARIGTTAADAAKKYLPKASIRLFDDEAQAVQELMSGRAHGMVASAPLPAFQALKYNKKLFLPFTGTFTKEPIGFALKKGDVDTLNFFNNWIGLMHAEGWLKDRKAYWFESDKWRAQLK